MGLNQTKFISMGPIWNTSGTETVISVSVLGPERAGTETGCIPKKSRLQQIRDQKMFIYQQVQTKVLPVWSLMK